MLESGLISAEFNPDRNRKRKGQESLIREGAPALLLVSELRDIYSRLAPLIQIADRFWEGRARKLGVDLAGIRANERVLEIGLGSGLALKHFKMKEPPGLKVGVDINRSMIETSLQSLSPDDQGLVRFCECNALSLPFVDSFFDLVFCAYVFETLSLPDIDIALAEARRVLKPSGRMAIVHLSARSWWFNQAWKPLYWFVPNLLGGCRPIELTDYLPNAGFRVREARSIIEWGIPSDVILLESTK